jgi:septal ring factor EnvC (AmiA/AmiB activator)
MHATLDLLNSFRKDLQSHLQPPTLPLDTLALKRTAHATLVRELYAQTQSNTILQTLNAQKLERNTQIETEFAEKRGALAQVESSVAGLEQQIRDAKMRIAQRNEGFWF